MRFLHSAGSCQSYISYIVLPCLMSYQVQQICGRIFSVPGQAAGRPGGRAVEVRLCRLCRLCQAFAEVTRKNVQEKDPLKVS